MYAAREWPMQLLDKDGTLFGSLNEEPVLQRGDWVDRQHPVRAHEGQPHTWDDAGDSHTNPHSCPPGHRGRGSPNVLSKRKLQPRQTNRCKSTMITTAVISFFSLCLSSRHVHSNTPCACIPGVLSVIQSTRAWGVAHVFETLVDAVLGAVVSWVLVGVPLTVNKPPLAGVHPELEVPIRVAAEQSWGGLLARWMFRASWAVTLVIAAATRIGTSSSGCTPASGG